MKIKVLKEYKFLRGFENDVKFTTTQIFKDAIIDTVEDEVPDEDVQWLIDNGFAEEVKESGWWKPKEGDRYYFIDSSGYIKHDTWDNTFWEVDRYMMGNAFKTEEAAKRYRDYLKAIVTVRQDEGVMTPEEVIHADDAGTMIGRIVVDDMTRDPMAGFYNLYTAHPCVSTIYFNTREYAKASLDKHPDEWKIIANYDWSRE